MTSNNIFVSFGSLIFMEIKLSGKNKLILSCKSIDYEELN